MALAEQAHRAAALLQDQEYVRVVCHGDGDGLAAAGLLARALRREGVDFHITVERELTTDVVNRLQGEAQECLALLDLAPHGHDLSDLASRVVVIDHHAPAPGDRGDDAPAPRPGHALAHGALEVNSAAWQRDGAHEACAATVAYVVAVAMNSGNTDLFPLAVAGAISDRQHLGGLKGLNAELAAEAAEAGVTAETGLLLPAGAGLLEAIAQSPDPFLKGLAGRARAAKKLLDELELDADATAADLSPGEAKRLASSLALHLVEHGADARAVDGVVGPRYAVDAPGVDTAHALAELLTVSAAGGQPGLGLAALMGDAEAVGALQALAPDHRTGLLQALLRVEREGLADAGGLRAFRHPAAATLATVADLAQAYLSPDAPVVGVAEAEDGEVCVEARRSRRAARPDLAKLLEVAADAVDGRAGGHGWSAWARAPADQRDDFMRALEKAAAGEDDEG